VRKILIAAVQKTVVAFDTLPQTGLKIEDRLLQPQRFGVVDGGFRADEKTGFIILKAYGSMAKVKKGLATYFMFYSEKRWHQNLDRKTPAMVYFSTQPQRQAAA